MRILVMGLIMFVNMLLQSTLLGYIQIVGVRPNTALLIIVAYAMLRGDMEGAIYGFFAGLMQDIYFGRAIGIYALLGMLTGYVCGKPFRDFYRENILTPVLLTGIACVVYEFAFYIIYFLFRGQVNIVQYFGRLILPETAYTVLLSIPVYRLMYSVNQRLERHERYTRKLF